MEACRRANIESPQVSGPVVGHPPLKKTVTCAQKDLADARRWLADLGVGGEGVLHFTAQPLAALSGSFSTGPAGQSIRLSFTERPPGSTDEETFRLALRCLSLLAARAAAIDRAVARAAPPPDFLCPITLAVMRDPVAAADGRAYDRSAIAEWLARRRTSPLTNCAMPSARLASDDALRRRIDLWARDALEPESAPPPPPPPPPETAPETGK
jgi:hypothetical protein